MQNLREYRKYLRNMERHENGEVKNGEEEICVD